MLNVDFADLTSVMKHAGAAVMGVGTASGEYRTQEALRKAMESPLMGCSIGGAKGVLLNISGDPNVGIMETQEAASFLQSQIDPDANFIWGWVPDPSLKDLVQIVLIATGFVLANVSTEATIWASKIPSSAHKNIVPVLAVQFVVSGTTIQISPTFPSQNKGTPLPRNVAVDRKSVV